MRRLGLADVRSPTDGTVFSGNYGKLNKACGDTMLVR